VVAGFGGSALAGAGGGTARLFSRLWRFRRYLRPQARRLLLAMLAAAGYTAAALLEPWPLQILFDGVLLGRPVGFLGWDLAPLARERPLALLGGTVVAVVALAFARGHLYYLQSVLAATSGQDVVAAVRRALFAHLQTLSLSFHRRARSGDLLMRLTGDIAVLREMVAAALVGLLAQGLVVVGMVVVMARLDPGLTLAAMVLIPVLFVILSVFRLRLQRAARRQRKREGSLASTAHDVLQGIHLVQASTAERHENERFKEMNRRSLRAGIKSTRLEAALHRAVAVATAGGLGVVLWLGVQRVLEGRLSPGELLVFLAYVQGFHRPMRQLSKMTQRMAKASACADRVIEVLDEVPEVREAPDAVSLGHLEGRIRLRGVDFGYGDGPTVLHDIHLDVAPREKVALVGPTGAGKSTLLALLPRFYDPRRGEVLLDDLPVARVRLRSLRRRISYLSQEPVIFGASIAENIAYGALGRRGPPATGEEIELAARAARAHEFVLALPRGYDTVVGERGATLSGGQRQRIAIARALLRQAPVLVLDEPMTGLDPVAEREVLEALATLAAGRTTLMVAHHLGTVLDADRIVFLAGGRIVEQGTHEALLARGGPYAEFFLTQWKGLARGSRLQGAS
jgi:ATP-binding cassette subfamily B protein